MSAPGQVLDLIERSDGNVDACLSGACKETQVRRESVDPFFTALGRDVGNLRGYAEAYKDVVHEDAIRACGRLAGYPCDRKS